MMTREMNNAIIIGLMNKGDIPCLQQINLRNKVQEKEVKRDVRTKR